MSLGVCCDAEAMSMPPTAPSKADGAPYGFIVGYHYDTAPALHDAYHSVPRRVSARDTKPASTATDRCTTAATGMYVEPCAYYIIV